MPLPNSCAIAARIRRGKLRVARLLVIRRAAIRIRNLVDDTFGDAVHIGIGLNTGEVIVGTIGGGGNSNTPSSAMPSTSPHASNNSPKPPATPSC